MGMDSEKRYQVHSLAMEVNGGYVVMDTLPYGKQGTPVQCGKEYARRGNAQRKADQLNG